jgi:hypothetical protein
MVPETNNFECCASTEGFTLKYALVVVTFLAIGGLVVWFWNVGIAAPSWDSFYYQALAKSLLEGFGYRLSQDGPVQLKYVPGYPILIALVSLFSGSIALAAGLIPATAAVLLVVLVACAGPGISRTGRMISVLLLLANASFLIFSSTALSEIPFAAASFLFLMGLTARNPSRIRSVVLVGSFWTSCALRPEGILLFGPLFVEFRKRRETPFIYWLLLSVPVAWWMYVLRMESAGVGATYGSEVAWPSVTTILGQVRALSLLGLVYLFLAIVGGALHFSSLWPYVTFGLLSLALHLTWHYTDVRLYASLVGILSLTAGLGLFSVAALIRDRLRIPMRWTVAVFLSLALVEQIPRFFPEKRQCYQLDSVDYLTSYESMMELQKAGTLVTQSCDYLLTNESLVYSAILYSSLRVDSYSALSEVSTKLCAARAARVCLAADMVHKFIWHRDAETRVREISQAGCVTSAPLFAWHPPSGYYVEIYRCAEIVCLSSEPSPSNGSP